MADRTRRRLLDRMAAARARHRERHRPTGFGLALADSIDYVDPVRWDSLTTGASLFLQRRYLAVLERAGPDNLAARYALIYRGRTPVAAAVFQVVTVTGTRFMKTERAGVRRVLRRALTPPPLRPAPPPRDAARRGAGAQPLQELESASSSPAHARRCSRPRPISP